MRHTLRLTAAFTLVTLALSGCGGVKRAGRAVGRVFGMGGKTDAWVAVVSPQGAQTLRGTVIWGPGATVAASRATVSLSGGIPLSQHPWHIHKGKCGDNGEIVGPPNEYQVLIVDTDGSVKLVNDLSFPVTPSGDFYVNVHESAANMGNIIGCGPMIPRTNPDTAKAAAPRR